MSGWTKACWGGGGEAFPPVLLWCRWVVREIIFDDSADLWSHLHDCDQELYDHHPGPFQCRGGLLPRSPRQADLNCHDWGSLVWKGLRLGLCKASIFELDFVIFWNTQNYMVATWGLIVRYVWFTWEIRRLGFLSTQESLRCQIWRMRGFCPLLTNRLTISSANWCKIFASVQKVPEQISSSNLPFRVPKYESPDTTQSLRQWWPTAPRCEHWTTSAGFMCRWFQNAPFYCLHDNGDLLAISNGKKSHNWGSEILTRA